MAIAFVCGSSLLALGARQTARHTAQERVLQPTFIRDQFEALRLSSPLPFPKLHFQGYKTESRAMKKKISCQNAKSVAPAYRTHSAQKSLSVCFINQLSSSPGCALILLSDDSLCFLLEFTTRNLHRERCC